MPSPKARQRQIQTPASPVSSRAKCRGAYQLPLFADETWQVRGFANCDTSAKQPEKCAASGGESLVIYKNNISQFLNQVSREGGTVAASVPVLSQGNVPLYASSVA